MKAHTVAANVEGHPEPDAVAFFPLELPGSTSEACFGIGTRLLGTIVIMSAPEALALAARIHDVLQDLEQSVADENTTTIGADGLTGKSTRAQDGAQSSIAM